MGPSIRMIGADPSLTGRQCSPPRRRWEPHVPARATARAVWPVGPARTVGARAHPDGRGAPARVPGCLGQLRGGGMGYRIDIDHANCITCGVCMDVCPVEALDMQRPDHPGIEVGAGGGRPLAWAMEHPIQVGECIGCSICTVSYTHLRAHETVLDL